jgi:hypothetical protein
VTGVSARFWLKSAISDPKRGGKKGENTRKKGENAKRKGEVRVNARDFWLKSEVFWAVYPPRLRKKAQETATEMTICAAFPLPPMPTGPH